MKLESVELTEDEIYKKLESFCAYRERCQSEVIERLRELDVLEKDHQKFLQQLQENKFLDEVRFVAAFVRGKSNIKNWGINKIKAELRKKRIDEKLIQDQLSALDEGMYFIRLQQVLEKKNKILKEIDPYKRKQKLFTHALSKGYEPSLVQEALKTI